MTPSTVPLSNVCACWSGSLIPSAVEALRRGIEVERERFRGKPYVVVATRHEIDYEAILKRYLELVEGFPAEEAAVEDASRSAEAARQATLAEPGYGNHRWQVLEALPPVLGKDRSDCASVGCVFREWFSMETGSGYDSKEFEFRVLHVRAAEVIGPELFAYLGNQREVTAYLIRRGEAFNSGAEPSPAPDRSGIR